MLVRARAIALIAVFLGSLFSIAAPVAPVAAAAPKVAIIVGPVGTLTTTYRGYADAVASSATSAGATVVKVYSPNATWANVKAAVNGANVIVYFGHGNGYPNPYGSNELIDRANGWGLNRTTTNGDADQWTSTLAYCGEKALLGTLTSSDGAVQWDYCGGKTNTDGITPAAGFTMVYGQAHYAPGFGERYVETTPLTTLSEAQQRVRNYSYPVLKLGARGFIATAYGDTAAIVTRVLNGPTTTYGDIFRAGKGYSASTLTSMAHPDISGAQVWVQRTTISGFHFGQPDYWYAFAGNPNQSPSGATVPRPSVTALRPGPNSTNAQTTSIVTGTFDRPVTGVSDSSFVLRTSAGQVVPAAVTYNAYWKRAELRPTSALQAGSTYVATLSEGITSTEGGSLSPTTWRFTTSPPPPGSGMETFSPAVRLTFRAGTHTGYRFDTNGAPIQVRTVTLAGTSGASTSMRGPLAAQSGTWFYIVNGAWAGYWMRESSAVQLSATAVSGSPATPMTFDPPTRLSFGQGTHTGYRFDAAGRPTAERTVTLASGSGASTSRRSEIPNQYGDWFYVVNGAWAGYWMRASEVISLP